MGIYEGSPCQFCVPPKRRPGCHDAKKCPDWAEWEQVLAARKGMVQEKKRSYKQISDYKHDRSVKIEKEMRKKFRGR